MVIIQKDAVPVVIITTASNVFEDSSPESFIITCVWKEIDSILSYGSYQNSVLAKLRRVRAPMNIWQQFQ